MIRFFLLDVLLFLTPFALYAIYLFVSERNPFQLSSWHQRQLIILSATGILLVMVLFGLVGENAGRQLFGRNEAGDAAIGRR